MLLGSTSSLSAQQSQTWEEIPRAESHFVANVLPVLDAKCFACHGKDRDDVRGDYDMTTRASLLLGGESAEEAVIVGNPEASPLVKAIKWEELEMPPKENDRLSEQQIRDIEEWISDGAIWPSEQRIKQIQVAMRAAASDAEVRVDTGRGLDQTWDQRVYESENLWAYQPVAHEGFHVAESMADLNSNPIDELIKAQVNKVGLTFAPRADRPTLIRRATYDLLGLPPTMEEIDAFVSDPRSDQIAFAALVDRLLVSPHYGEQWGRHWLDVVRYADSSGFANDYERGNAWRYRDYVVRSFNEDKPYEQFVREQIAGDEISPNNSEALIAVGFLRMGPWELTGMEVAKVARQRFLDDVTDSVGQVFLGQMLQCARCHDHKFDPIPTRDFYSIQSVFAATQFAERSAPFLESENQSGFDELKYLAQRRKHYQQTLSQLESKRTLDAARRWLKENELDSAPFEQTIIKLAENSNRKPESIPLNQVRNQMSKQGVAPDLIPPRHVGFEPRDFGMERVARKGMERLTWREQRYEPLAMSVYNGPTPDLKSVYQPLAVPKPDQMQAPIDETCILVGGDPFSASEPVRPHGLSVLNETLGTEYSLPAIPETRSGRRSALAEWITDANNPLTSRVIANRIWQWHFGKPLAANPNNFGATGGKPTHPELLDALAQTLVNEKWSIKQLHRLIMNSEAYCRSTQHAQQEELEELDPNRELYAVFLPRRLEAEEIRDSMRFASGELNLEIGGIPVRPEMNEEAAFQPRQVMGTFAEAWQPSPLPEQRHRRAIYALRLRGQSDPFLNVFNAPNSDTSCETRDVSTITPQVFALFNSKDSYDRALAFANRLLTVDTSATEKQVIEKLFEIGLGRQPQGNELAACLKHWQEMTKRHQALRFEPTELPTEVVRNAVEENTGERFQFSEPLEFYQDFKPDLQPYQTDARTRGLAEVCLVIFNSNEFMFVY